MALKLLIELLMILLIPLYDNPMVSASLSMEEDLEFERQLKILNKPPIKTFQTTEGDIIDCIDINKQPALDHPLLKNHKVQIKPTALPKRLKEMLSKNAKPISIIPQRSEACPAGTVPIRRTQKEDLVRMRSLPNPKEPLPLINFGQHSVSDSPLPNDDARKHAVYATLNKGPTYYGAYGRVAAYNLSVNDQQLSSANLWIHNVPPGGDQSRNFIIAGWAVSFALNNDTLTRLFTYWWGNNSGCFNTRCPGFVSTNPSVGPDHTLWPTSTYGGAQYEILLFVFQDRATGNWWFAVTSNITCVGYWPKELVPGLSNGATDVAWGGVAIADKDGNSPPMGSGHFPSNDYTRSCFFRKIQFVNDHNQLQTPPDDAVFHHIDRGQSGCYGIVDNTDCGYYKQMHYCFTFGGPGGKCSG